MNDMPPRASETFKASAPGDVLALLDALPNAPTRSIVFATGAEAWLCAHGITLPEPPPPTRASAAQAARSENARKRRVKSR